MKKLALSLGLALIGCDGTVSPFADVSTDRGAPRDGETQTMDATVTMDASADSAADAAAIDAHEASTPVDTGVIIDTGLSCGSGPPDCEPGPGTGNADQCFDAPSCFLRTVQNAIRTVIANNPTCFDQSMGSPRVLDEPCYMNGVVMELQRQGLCARIDPNAGDEIVVKHDNTLSENFDILTADNLVRSGGGIFTATCAPAWF